MVKTFSEDVQAQLKYYVYIIKDPETGQIVYIGKGNGNRVLNHKKGDAYILAYGLNEKEALSLEAILIEVIGKIKIIPKLKNKKSGDKNKCDWKIGPWTVDNISEQLKHDPYVIAINISKSYPEKTIYEAVRGDCALNPDNANKAEYILAVYKGVVIGVFQTDKNGWQPSKETEGRYCFRGHEVTDPKIRKKYIGMSIEFKRGQANPIQYLYI